MFMKFLQLWEVPFPVCKIMNISEIGAHSSYVDAIVHIPRTVLEA